MGLEDFIDDDDDSSSNSSSSSSTTSSTSTNTDPLGGDIDDYDMNFYGAGNSTPRNTPMEREKAMSDYPTRQLSTIKDGEIELDSDHVKYHCPVFYMINPNPQYSSGDHYQLKYTGEVPRPSWHNRMVSCVGTHGTRLGNVQKEAVMFALGEHDKEKAMKKLRDTLGDDIDAETHVYISFFGNMMMLRDLSQANNEFREGDLINRDKIMHQVLSAKTLEARINEEK